MWPFFSFSQPLTQTYYKPPSFCTCACDDHYQDSCHGGNTEEIDKRCTGIGELATLLIVSYTRQQSSLNAAMSVIMVGYLATFLKVCRLQWFSLNEWLSGMIHSFHCIHRTYCCSQKSSLCACHGCHSGQLFVQQPTFCYLVHCY